MAEQQNEFNFKAMAESLQEQRQKNIEELKKHAEESKAELKQKGTIFCFLVTAAMFTTFSPHFRINTYLNNTNNIPFAPQIFRIINAKYEDFSAPYQRT